MPKTIEIDASGQVLGRLASRIALILQGKDEATFQGNIVTDVMVKVKGVSSVKVTGGKMDSKIYRWYTGYPGGIRERRLKEVLQKNPAWVLRHAVAGMLPKNRLRSRRIKRLIIIK